ncbi:MAG TPA: hypothetical protein PLD99_01015 [Parcubacteria group bacterium]|nr:hypothetical protein [Parcubacteria group bacterium]
MQHELEVVDVVEKNGKKVAKIKHQCDPTRLITLTETAVGWVDELGVKYPADYIEV